MEIIYCKYCSNNKKREDFNKSVKQKNGLQQKCRECEKKYKSGRIDILAKQQKQRYYKNIEESRQKHKEYYQKTKNIDSLRRKKKYKENREQILLRRKKWELKNKEILKQKRHERYIKNIEHERKMAKLRRDRKINEYREYQRIWTKNRRITDPQYSISQRLRSRLSSALKKHKGKKQAKLIELVGCSLEQLKIYIESKFTENMTWEKFFNAEIEIDHIKPCCSFDLTQESEQRKCFHYSNLQPLWQKDNRIKSYKDIKLKI